MGGIWTGWFGIPGGPPGGMVHVVIDGKPICGSKMGPKMKFQWCARGVQREFLECRRCENKIRRAPKWLQEVLAA